MGSYPQDASGYGPTRTNYSTDTQGYSQQTGYNYDSSTYQSYGDTQGTTQYVYVGVYLDPFVMLKVSLWEDHC